MDFFRFFVLVITTIQCCNTFQICSEEFPETPINQFRCVQRETGQIDNSKVNTTCELDSNVTLTVVNSLAGTLSVEFKLAPAKCNFFIYELKLYIDESIKDEETCSQLKSIEHLHSERELIASRDMEETKLRDCKDVETVTFKYVYTGCYVLAIKVESDYTFVNPTFIETNYVKTSLTTPQISTKYLPTEGELEFEFTNMNALNVTNLDLHTRMCTTYPCNCNEGAKTHWWEIAFSPSNDFKCRAKNNKTLTSSTKCVLDKSGDRMRCSIKIATSGIYCVLMQIYDDRCKEDTVWLNESKWPCLYNTIPMNVTAQNETQSTTVKQPPSGPVFDIVISVLAVLCVISLGVLLYLWLRGKPKPQLVFQPEKQVLTQQRASIVLLYALDCKPFMTLMSLFRGILKEITKCEVYDCFDPERAEEIALNKTDWLRKHMTYSKIVLVENKCAVLHQKALLEQRKLRYRETVSTFVDDLFIYGLKMLTDDCFGRSMYERVLVVRVEGFTDTKDVLSHVAPLTRYALPQHMELLLSNLYQSQSEYEMDSNMLKFMEHVKSLVNYRTEKPDYLDSLFMADIN